MQNTLVIAVMLSLLVVKGKEGGMAEQSAALFVIFVAVYITFTLEVISKKTATAVLVT